jgi:four helix bundle protein
MATIKDFEDLKTWQIARELCKDVFRITRYEQFSKDFKLKDQIRGSSGSIMDNIADGFERNGNKEFTQFLAIAKGSSGEMRSQLYRAFDFGYIEETEFEELRQRTKNLSQSIGAFITYLNQSEIKGPKYKRN